MAVRLRWKFWDSFDVKGILSRLKSYFVMLNESFLCKISYFFDVFYVKIFVKDFLKFTSRSDNFC